MHPNTPPNPSTSSVPTPTIFFAGVPCHLHHGHYAIGGKTALQLRDASDGELVATATMNIFGIHLEADEVVLKTWDENEGLLEVLVAAGILHPPHDHYPVGLHLAPIARLVPMPR